MPPRRCSVDAFSAVVEVASPSSFSPWVCLSSILVCQGRALEAHVLELAEVHAGLQLPARAEPHRHADVEVGVGAPRGDRATQHRRARDDHDRAWVVLHPVGDLGEHALRARRRHPALDLRHEQRGQCLRELLDALDLLGVGRLRLVLQEVADGCTTRRERLLDVAVERVERHVLAHQSRHLTPQPLAQHRLPARAHDGLAFTVASVLLGHGVGRAPRLTLHRARLRGRGGGAGFATGRCVDAHASHRTPPGRRPARPSPMRSRV